MGNDLRTAAQQALEAQKALLSLVEDPCPYDAATTRAAARASITALEAALAEPVQEPDHTYKLIGCVQHDCEECQRRTQRPAEPVQEPVGYFSVNDYGLWEENKSGHGTPLYTAPFNRA